MYTRTLRDRPFTVIRHAGWCLSLAMAAALSASPARAIASDKVFFRGADPVGDYTFTAPDGYTYTRDVAPDNGCKVNGNEIVCNVTFIHNGVCETQTTTCIWNGTKNTCTHVFVEAVPQANQCT